MKVTVSDSRVEIGDEFAPVLRVTAEIELEIVALEDDSTPEALAREKLGAAVFDAIRKSPPPKLPHVPTQ